jgi:hypothetical protein
MRYNSSKRKLQRALSLSACCTSLMATWMRCSLDDGGSITHAGIGPLGRNNGASAEDPCDLSDPIYQNLTLKITLYLTLKI